MADDLASWLLAQIAEDRRAVAGHFGPPREDDDVPLQRWDYDEVRIGPARVLAECDAKERIVKLHDASETRGEHECPSLTDNAYSSFVYDCGTLRLLALPYADRDGFREEWKV